MAFDISKCKPFDLERAIAGDKVVTRKGQEVLQLLYADKAEDACKVIAVLNDGHLNITYSNGSVYDDGFENGADLFMSPKEPKVSKKYFKLGKGNNIFFFEFEPDLENWYMYIEYHDGEPVKAVFAKDVK